MKKILALASLLVTVAALGATTFTTNYNFNKPGDGDRNYGELIRDNWDAVDTQIKVNADSVANHLADTTAHDATDIVTTPGSNSCTTQTTVQAYLDCLDGTLDPSVSGVVLITGAQTITGIKTFQSGAGPVFSSGANPVFQGATSGILNTDGSGVLSASTFGSLDPLTTKGDIFVYSSGDTARFAVGSDDQVLTAASGETAGIDWTDRNPKWTKYTVSSADLSTAGTTFSVTIFSLAAAEVIDDVIVKHTTAFSGGSISAYTVEVGTSADKDRFMTPFDVFQSVSGTRAKTSSTTQVPNFGTTTDVVVTATSTGDNLNAATAGSVDVYVRTSTLP